MHFLDQELIVPRLKKGNHKKLSKLNAFINEGELRTMGFQLGICFVILICFKNGMALSMKESEKVAKTCKDLLQPKKLYEPTGSKIIVDFRDSYDYLKLPFYSNVWKYLKKMSEKLNDNKSHTLIGNLFLGRFGLQ